MRLPKGTHLLTPQLHLPGPQIPPQIPCSAEVLSPNFCPTPTSSEGEWDFYWCDVSWLRENFDHTYMGEHVRISHFRNHYEVSRVGLETGHGNEQQLARNTGTRMEKYKGIWSCMPGVGYVH